MRLGMILLLVACGAVVAAGVIGSLAHAPAADIVVGAAALLAWFVGAVAAAWAVQRVASHPRPTDRDGGRT